ncbi:chemotaxis protein CheX [Peribacillus simplex]
MLIEISGDIRGRIIIEGTNGCMSKIGEGMFGIPIEGEMLESFAAELGNMLAGQYRHLLRNGEYNYGYYTSHRHCGQYQNVWV